MKAFHQGAAAAAVLLCAAWPVAAQQSSPVETRLEARKVVTGADGKESFAGAESARPGDVIEYIATYRNTSRQPVKNLAATLPIPSNTELVAGSVRPASARASLDSRTFADLPLKRSVQRNGQLVEETVPLSEYRSLRWNAGELAGAASASFAARVKVLDDRK